MTPSMLLSETEATETEEEHDKHSAITLSSSGFSQNQQAPRQAQR